MILLAVVALTVVETLVLLPVLNLNRWLSRNAIDCSFVKPCCYCLQSLNGRREFVPSVCKVCFVSRRLVVCTVQVIVIPHETTLVCNRQV